MWINIEQGKVSRPRLLIELAEVLQTSPDWLLKGKGPEEVRTPNPIEEILLLSQQVAPEKLGAVIGLLKRLSDATEAA